MGIRHELLGVINHLLSWDYPLSFCTFWQKEKEKCRC